MTERHFALSDVEYNIITTLSNLLQSEDALHKYIADAEKAGDSNTAAIFGEIHDSNREYAKKLREALHDQFMNRQDAK